jgi:hypothetical protein
MWAALSADHDAYHGLNYAVKDWAGASFGASFGALFRASLGVMCNRPLEAQAGPRAKLD